MTFSNEIIFLMLNLIVLGMTVHAKSLYEGLKDTRPSRALIMTFVSANVSAISALSYIWVSPVFLTLTNTLLLTTLCCAALTARSWRMILTPGLIRWVVAFLLCIGLVFEFLRQNGSYLQRVVVYSLLSALFLSWLIYLAWQKHQEENSFQLKFLMAVAFASMGFRLARMTAVLLLDVQPETLFQEGSAPAVFRLMSLSMDILILSSLLGYSTHRLAVRNLLTQRDNQRVLQANQALDIALAEKNQMIKALTLSVKSNNLGVLLGSFVHELSQPLQSMRLRSEMLVSMPEMASGLREQLLQDVLLDNQRSVDIITQLRSFLQHGAAGQERISVSDVLGQTLAVMQPEWGKHKITLSQEIEVSVWAWANVGQLQMVVLNLLRNAVDVLRASSEPRVIGLMLRQVGQEAVLAVSDNGPGIPEAQWTQVFDLFYSTKSDGMGLGLWLSRMIVQNHGGSLDVSRSALGGACFTLRLPSEPLASSGSAQ